VRPTRFGRAAEHALGARESCQDEGTKLFLEGRFLELSLNEVMKLRIRLRMLQRIGSERAVRRLSEFGISVLAAFVGVVGLTALYLRLIHGLVAFYVFTAASSQVVNGNVQTTVLDRQVVPALDFHLLPVLLPCIGGALLLSVVPLGAFLHGLCFIKRGLTVLSIATGVLWMVLLVAVVYGNLLSVYVLAQGALWLLPAAVLSLLAVVIGVYIERVEGDPFPLPD